jgi:hypothetical protein
VCGDFNVNFLNESVYKTQLLLLLQSFNLFNTVHFPTRITDNSSSLIDNIFIDNIRRNSFDVFPVTNGLSDHDAQCLVLKNISNLHKHKVQSTRIRIVNKDSLTQFQKKIFYENWENIYQSKEVNDAYNLFLNTFLLIHESCFPKQNVRKAEIDDG